MDLSTAYEMLRVRPDVLKMLGLGVYESRNSLHEDPCHSQKDVSSKRRRLS